MVGLSWKEVALPYMLPLQAHHNRPPESGDSETPSPFIPWSIRTFWRNTSPHIHYGLLILLSEDFISGHKLMEVTFIVLLSSAQAWKFILKSHVIKLSQKLHFPRLIWDRDIPCIKHLLWARVFTSLRSPFIYPQNNCKLQKGNARHGGVKQCA